MTPLCNIAAQFQTDKLTPHNYTPVYFRLLRDKNVRRLLEVGIGKKARSLRMWEAFLPEAEIFGIDKRPEYLRNQGRIQSFAADQANHEQMTKLATDLGGNFDVIIDDGAHDPERQLACLSALLPFLAKDGIYFIEDIIYDDVSPLVGALPRGFSHEFYEGEKIVAATGRGERLMIVRPG
jgi:hypothetical protein